MSKEENKFVLQSTGTMSVMGCETDPAWPDFKKFATLVSCSFVGTEWLIPWVYFKAGWEIQENKQPLNL